MIDNNLNNNDIENNYKKIADLLFPTITKTPSYYKDMYKKRNLPQGAEVTRFAPSPTGFVHFGSLLTCLINRKIAKDTNGVFFLRIEDTDLERQVENGIEGIIKDLNSFNIVPNEGVFLNENNKVYEKGNYGPYIQTARKEIYQTFIKDMVARGVAYPCFCSKEEVDEIRNIQTEIKENHIGYWGQYAKCRHLSLHDIETNLKNNKPFVIRLKSPGRPNHKIKVKDVLRGKIEMQDNVIDAILLKSDSQLPPYNLAHAVDDTLMGTTTVMRSNEWLNSTPEHLQIFHAIGEPAPQYAHVAFVQIIDPQTGFKRKLSKRLDPHTAISNLLLKGYPVESVYEYLLVLANTNFEDWRKQNPQSSIDEFRLELNKMSVSGPLYDQQKFDDISKNVIATFSPEKLYNMSLEWTSRHSLEFYNELVANKEYSIKMLEIDRVGDKPHKDIKCLSEVKDAYLLFFNNLFNKLTKENYEIDETFDQNAVNILKDFLAIYNFNDDKETWFDKIKEITVKYNYAVSIKDYKVNKENYSGSIIHVSNFLRVAITAKQRSLDLYAIMQHIGYDNVVQRVNKLISYLQ